MNRISAIVNGKRGISVDTAMRLGHYFGTSAAMWLSLQMTYDLEVARLKIGAAIEQEVLPWETAT